MEDGEKQSLEQIRAFLEASGEVCFQAHNRGELYGWLQQTLRRQDYGHLKREGKGQVRRYLAKMTGMSRAQVTRLIGCYQQSGEVRPRAYRRHRFPSVYRRGDIERLAAVDEAHETLSGPATQKILQRELHEFHDARYERLAQLSVAQLYRLRKSRTYRQRRVAYQPTRPTQVAIGERFAVPTIVCAASGANPIRRTGRVTCAWTPCIKATWTESRACITSTRWMK